MPERGMLVEPRHDEPTGRELAIDVMGLRKWIESEFNRVDGRADRELHRVDEHLASEFRRIDAHMLAEFHRIHERLSMHVEASNQRFADQTDAVKTALLAQKELNAVVQAAADRAITKAEEGQKAVNEVNNGFRVQLKEQNDINISRVETLAAIGSSNEKIDRGLAALQAMIKDNDERAAKARELQREDIVELREAQSRELGRQSQQSAGRTDSRGTLALIVSAVGVGLVLLTSTGMLRGPAPAPAPAPASYAPAPAPAPPINIIVPGGASGQQPSIGPGQPGTVTDTKSTTVPK